MIQQLFFELIRISIGTQVTLSRQPSADEWKELYAMAKKQSLVGICFAGVQKLYVFDNPESTFDSPEATKTPESITKNLDEVQYLRWMGMAAKIQQRNEVMDGYTEEVNRYFDGIGVPSMILKGQAIGTLYGGLRNLRQSGDVDVWVKMSRKDLFDWSQKKFGQVEGYNGFHIHSPFFKDAEVEVHFIPGAFSSPFSNRRFTKFCGMHEPKLNDRSMNLAFNLVYILQHCYNHLCGHGVGLRQVMDYYFVLREASHRLSPEGRRDCAQVIRRLGMEKFAGAVLWVIGYLFEGDANFASFKKGLGEGFLEPNDKLGRFLLNEILMTGNMGHHDERVKAGTWSTAKGRYWYKIKRSMYLAKICPQEVFWRPWMSLISYVKIKFQK